MKDEIKNLLGKNVVITLRIGFVYYGNLIEASEEMIVLETTKYGRTMVSRKDIVCMHEKKNARDF